MPTPVRIIERRPKEAPCCGGANIITSEALGGGTPCEDQPFSLITNGDFALEVNWGTSAPNNIDSWNLYEAASFGGLTDWSAGRVVVTANNIFSATYLYYDVYINATGQLTGFIDRTKNLYLQLDLTAINVRNGKRIIVTLQCVNASNMDSHYYQFLLDSEPYGTFNLTVTPSDWVSGITPGGFGTIGSGQWGAEPITFRIDTGNAGSGRDDDYYLDNVVLYQNVCI